MSWNVVVLVQLWPMVMFLIRGCAPESHRDEAAGGDEKGINIEFCENKIAADFEKIV